MSKDDLLFAVAGIALGVVLGFQIANWTAKAVTESKPGQRDALASVNSSNAPELPPGHPNISGGQTAGGAQQLPAGHPEVGAGGGPSAGGADAAGSTELPSLDPLPAGSKLERAEQKYKNIQVLKGVPSERWMPIMFAFKNSLGVECTFCHVKDEWDKDDKENKQTARKMIKMVKDINSELGAAGRVSCFTCHRGQQRPAR